MRTDRQADRHTDTLIAIVCGRSILLLSVLWRQYNVLPIFWMTSSKKPEVHYKMLNVLVLHGVRAQFSVNFSYIKANSKVFFVKLAHLKW